jgi:threonine/homoserine/homoserine lactone efflux protein
MGLLAFLLMAMVSSLSGVLMPGPITAVSVAGGARSPHAGGLVALGHAVVEWPLMALIYFGVGELFKISAVKIGILGGGGLVLVWMGIDMLRNFRRVGVSEPPSSASPFVAGILLSAGNPYFLIWWATIGAALVGKSLQFGRLGFVLLAVFHWLCDLIWYYFLSALAYRGGKFFGRKIQQGVFVVCGLALLYFAGSFLADAIQNLLG